MSISSDADGNVTVGAPSATGEAKAPLPYGLEGQPQVAVVHLEVIDAPSVLVGFTLDGVPHLYRKG